MSRATRRWRALVLAAVGASQDWTASLLSRSSLGTPSSGFNLGVLVNVDRQADSKVSSNALIFDSMWAFQPVRFELVSCDCQPSLPLLSLSLSLSVSLSIALSLSLSLSFPLSFFPPHYVLCTQTTAETWNRAGIHSVITARQLLFQDVVGLHVPVACSVADWDALPLLLPLFLSPPLIQSPVTSSHTQRYFQHRWCSKAGSLSSEADQPWEAPIPTATSTRARRRRVAHNMRWEGP